VIVDSSAWIDYIRGSDDPVVARVTETLRAGAAATSDAVRLELLAGTWRGVTAETLAALLDLCRDLPQLPREDVEAAAELYRRCRRSGETIRSLNDCLIAAIAIRNDIPVLHKDRDYDVIARYSDLQVSRG
jgi:predicted nucleic acid-binding protein